MSARIEAVEGDITTQRVDVIVNAANSALSGGGGIDGAIHKAAGPELLEACRRLRTTDLPDGLPTGDAVATDAYGLSAQWVVHTVGPNRHAGQTDPALLASAFTRSLDVAAELGATTVAMPAVGAGLYGWTAEECARVAVPAVRDHPAVEAGEIDLVRFVLFSKEAYDPFVAALGGRQR